MKVNELIKKLEQYNPEANVIVFANGSIRDYSLIWMGSEGGSKDDCFEVSFYCDKTEDESSGQNN